jgi:poly-gamma-glutamate capsule biosynthesis protein CapA/YwtB (metallophosphatase superfamily)
LAWVALGLAACGPASAKAQPLGTTPTLPMAVTLPAEADSPTPAAPTPVVVGTLIAAPTQFGTRTGSAVGAGVGQIALPALFATPTPILSPGPTVVPETDLLFTGDINPARCVYAIAKAANDMDLPYRPLASLLQSADIAIGSLDGAISDYNPPTPCIGTTRNLLAPAEAAQGLGYAGFDVITVATNHIKDCGLVRGCINNSMFDTLANLRTQGIQPTGAGANLAEATTPAFITAHGVRFAFIGVSAINNPIWAAADAAGTVPFQAEVYLDAIRRAKAEADVVVVLPHWGREYTGDISFEQRQAAAAMVAAGATLVIGNHPHHVQGVETFPNGAVAAYALGNFVFDQAWSDGTLYTLEGLLLRATFQGSKLAGIELLPVHIYDDFQPRLADPAESAAILKVVADSMAHAPPP